MQDDSHSKLHRECSELLPWLVNGSLAEEQSLRIKSHLQTCTQCGEEYAEQLALRDHMQRTDTVVYAPHASLQKLMARIEAPDSPPLHYKPPAAAPRGSGTHRWLAAAVLVESIGIGLLAGMLWWKNAQEQSAPRFATLTSAAPISARGPLIRIVFAPTAAADEINALVRSVGAQIVAGPSEADVYTLSLPPEERASEVAAQITRLRNDPRIRFAEPAISDFREGR